MAKETSNQVERKNKKKSIKELGGMLFAKMMRGGASELRANAEEVNRLNVFPVPDGDTGDNMSMTIESGIAALETVDSDDLAEVMRVASRGMLLGARGNSGVILSQFFAGIAKGFESAETADARTLGRALELGVEQAYMSVVTPTEGTILTVAREAVEYAVSKINQKSTVRSVFGNLVKEMHRSLERTPELMTILKDAGVVDSGAAGLYYIMDGLNKVLNGIEVAESTQKNAKPQKAVAFGPDSDLTYGYCTEVTLQLQSARCVIESFDVEMLKPRLSELGDSIVAFKTDSIFKLHIHTKTPEKILELCHEYGEFISVKIENMTLQHNETAMQKDYAIVAVSIGSGISEVFKNLGADVVIDTDIAKAPATQDFIDAFEKVCAKVIYVFPNNSNIFMAAAQAAQIYTESRVYIVNSKSIGACYAALSAASFDGENADKALVLADEVIARTKSGHVCPAVRDTEMDGITIREGDTLGIIDKRIVTAQGERMNAIKETINQLLENNEHSVLTVFSGKDSTKDEENIILDYIASTFSDREAFMIKGGQEIYSYIFVAE